LAWLDASEGELFVSKIREMREFVNKDWKRKDRKVKGAVETGKG
jgi:hypothetical protein